VSSFLAAHEHSKSVHCHVIPTSALRCPQNSLFVNEIVLHIFFITQKGQVQN